MTRGTAAIGSVRTDAPYIFDNTVRVNGTLSTAGVTGTTVNGTSGPFTVTGHLVTSGTAPTAAAGANAGATPPAPVVATTSDDNSGSLTFGTGTTPAAGAQVVVTFNTAFAVAPAVTVQPTNAGTAALNIYPTTISTTGFTVACTTAPTGSQANTTYAVNWVVLG